MTSPLKVLEKVVIYLINRGLVPTVAGYCEILPLKIWPLQESNNARFMPVAAFVFGLVYEKFLSEIIDIFRTCFFS